MDFLNDGKVGRVIYEITLLFLIFAFISLKITVSK